MPDAQELQSVVEAAEQAAAAGDYASAERLLREVASLQEASLGALHPDLANTLNNLGVVCEITGKDADAEQFFRRSSSIAAAALPPDHPFVATSRKNLEDFCTARGKPVDLPTAPAPSDAPAQAPLITDLIPPKRSERPVAPAPSATTCGTGAIRPRVAVTHDRHHRRRCRRVLDRRCRMAPFAASHGIVVSVTNCDTERAVGPRAAVSLQSGRECSTQGNRVHERSAAGRRAKDTSTHRAGAKDCARLEPGAGGSHRGALQGSLYVRRVAMCDSGQSGRSWRALLLHADQVSDRHNRPPSLV